ncbi:MAG TPA: hypothetical protein VK694_05650 [Verrucomicrobiae bacterium]|nr:hypothetical protein [Verrucomicrobiae bacterium]
MSAETEPGIPNYMNGEVLALSDTDTPATEPEIDTDTPVQPHADAIDDIRNERNSNYGYGGENFGV